MLIMMMMVHVGIDVAWPFSWLKPFLSSPPPHWPAPKSARSLSLASTSPSQANLSVASVASSPATDRSASRSLAAATTRPPCQLLNHSHHFTTRLSCRGAPTISTIKHRRLRQQQRAPIVAVSNVLSAATSRFQSHSDPLHHHHPPRLDARLRFVSPA